MTDKKKKILIIEDEEALNNVLVSKFKKEGYEVEAAFDGEEGYKKIEEWAPDLILLDIVMPRMNGYEVLEKMKENGKKIPVIIISNSGQPVEIEKAIQLGAVDALVKTQFDPAEVVAKVKNYLAKDGAVLKKEAADISAPDGDSKRKILVVEDDGFLRGLIVKKLQKENFAVFEMIDGEEALKNIEKIKPDMALLDIILPAIDGFGVLEAIRANKDKKISKTPVIMLSNLGQESDVQKALNLGANDYLIKAHFTTEEIVKKINSILGTI